MSKSLKQLKAQFIINPEAELSKFINEWADEEKHPEHATNNLTTPYGRGYEAACHDILTKMMELGLWKEYWKKKPAEAQTKTERAES